MARSNEVATVRIRGRGLRKSERMVQNDQRVVREVVRDSVEETGLTAVEILRANAPERTGRLRAAIGVTGQNRSSFRPEIRVGLNPVSDEGFPYVNVTRFGRRAVEAKTQRPNFRTDAGIGGSRVSRDGGFRRAHMLAFERGGPGSPIIYRRRVRAYHPRRDWVAASAPEIQRNADANFRYITQQVERILKSDTQARQTSIAVRTRAGRFRGVR